MTMWAIHAVANVSEGDWTSARQLPTFYLNGDVQGIVSADHACRVALDIVARPGETVQLAAYPV